MNPEFDSDPELDICYNLKLGEFNVITTVYTMNQSQTLDFCQNILFVYM